MWLNSSIGRAFHRLLKGRGFESLSKPNFFQVIFPVVFIWLHSHLLFSHIFVFSGSSRYANSLSELKLKFFSALVLFCFAIVVGITDGSKSGWEANLSSERCKMNYRRRKSLSLIKLMSYEIRIKSLVSLNEALAIFVKTRRSCTRRCHTAKS